MTPEQKIQLWRGDEHYQIPRIHSRIVPLDVGGEEGAKFYLEIDQLSPDEHHRQFIIKRYAMYDLGVVTGIVGATRWLFTHGYPVPPDTGYYLEGSNVFLVMDDMSKRGAYRLWGVNDQPTPAEKALFRSMELSHNDRDLIHRGVHDLSQQATADGFLIDWSLYHIRQDIETRAVDIVLLDIRHDTMPYQQSSYLNTSEARRFLNRFDREWNEMTVG